MRCDVMRGEFGCIDIYKCFLVLFIGLCVCVYVPKEEGKKVIKKGS